MSARRLPLREKGSRSVCLNTPVALDELCSSLDQAGFVLLRGVFATEMVEEFAGVAEECFRELEAIRTRHGAEAVARSLPPGQKYLPAASSFTFDAIFQEDRRRQVLGALATRPLRPLIETVLGGPCACDLDQAWVRRQYAPGHYPPGHAPHGWHQDGALGFDFTAVGGTEPGSEALLRLVTCWVPLTPCGSEAPGLEFLARRWERLRPVAGLREEQLRVEFPPEEFHRPVLQPGDGLVFLGDTLHRTHVTPEMRRDRTSLEFRFVAANRIPPRLAMDRFLPLG